MYTINSQDISFHDNLSSFPTSGKENKETNCNTTKVTKLSTNITPL
jgi:hypothetical protein